MLAERLTPLQSFLANQAQIAQQQEYRVQQEASMTIEQMAQDNINFPHFDSVRADMADIIEMNARRQNFLPPQQAYQRAVAMNPEWGAQLAAQAQQGRQLTQAQQVNARAQRALNASSGVTGAPTGSPVGGGSQGGTLRDTIEAAFSQVAGR
jgi:Ca2+-dependent lipid-binding protein